MVKETDGQGYEGRAEECLKEALELCYAYFNPELDNFEDDKITVNDILVKVEFEKDLLDEGHMKDLVEDHEFKWNANRNKAWRKKAIAFIHKWADETGEYAKEYKSIK